MKKGISLVVLVITIIVLIILTTTVILISKEGGIIAKATEATFKSDFSNILDSFNLNKTNIMLNNLGNTENITATTYNDLEKYIPIIGKQNMQKKTIKSKNYLDLIQIYESRLYQKDGINDEDIEKWLDEVGIPKLIIEPIKYDDSQTNLWQVDSYIENGENKYKITKYNGENLNNVTIPGIITKDGVDYKITKIEGEYVNSLYKNIYGGKTDNTFTGTLTISNGIEIIGNSAFSFSNITNVVIPTSIINIKDGAFAANSNLTSVVIPDSVESIGSGAFTLCANLRSVKIGNGVKKINNGAFAQAGIVDLIIDESVEIIDSSAFQACSNLKSIIIPDSVTQINSNAFTACEKVETIKIGKNVTYIGLAAFSACGVTDLKIPNNVPIKIDRGAFEICTKLKTISIPDNVTLIGDYSFNICDKLEEVRVGNEILKGRVLSLVSGLSQNVDVKIDTSINAKQN